MARTSTLPQEELIRLFINGRFFSHLLCTPVNMKELAIGWLFTQGIINSLDEMSSLDLCDGVSDIRVSLKSEVVWQPSQYRPVTSSGCSGGQMNSLQYLKDVAKLESSLTVRSRDLVRIMSAMFHKLAALNNNSGMHCASLVSGADFSDMLLGYDVGRHNAVDKVIGAGLLKGIGFDRTVLATSGRVSSDMVLKAAAAGVPIIVSQRSVTSLAAHIASSAGIAVVGRLTKPDRLVIGQTDRIIG